MKKTQIIMIVLVASIVFVSACTSSTKENVKDVPESVSGEMRSVYEWAKTPEGATLLEKVPCYCGCKNDGHLHARHCFWTDDGSFDAHGTTCAVCLDIGKKTKKMSEEGKEICEIVYEIDKFYASNIHLRTDTPIPEGCTAYAPTGNEPKLPEGCGNEDALSCPAS